MRAQEELETTSEPTNDVLVLGCRGMRVEVRASAEDMAWLRPLFTRYHEPFRALRDMGYEPERSSARVPGGQER